MQADYGSKNDENGFRADNIPKAICILFPVTFLISYTWSVLTGNVPAALPYISDTGAFAPISCFFGEMLNLGALLVAALIYFRYMEVTTFVHCEHFPRWGTINKVGLFFGLASAFGLTLVANFQEPNEFHTHTIGAFFVFGLGLVYMWIEVYRTYQLSKCCVQQRKVFGMRLILTAVNTATFVGTVVALGIALAHYNPTGERLRQQWGPDDGGYAAHVVSAAFEWILGLTQLFFFATYTLELRSFKVTYPKLVPLPVPKQRFCSKTAEDNKSRNGAVTIPETE